MINNVYNVDDVTFVSGYWDLEKPIKYKYSHYIDIMPKTFDILKNKNIAFFYEDENWFDRVNNYVKSNKIQFYHLPLKNLPAHQITSDYIQTCKEQDDERLKKIYPLKTKGWVYNEVFEKGLGKKTMLTKHEPSYFSQICIMLSKSFLVEKVIEENPFNTNYFAWVDLSIARFKEKRKNWNFIEFNFTDEHMYHYSSFMRNYGELQKVNGSFMLGHKNKWEEFMPLYNSELIKLKDSKYCHSDESVITSVVNKSPELFSAIDNGEIPSWK